jgi:hypothetical protein
MIIMQYYRWKWKQGIFSIGIMITGMMYTQQEVFSLNKVMHKPFAESWYTKSLNTCMQTWSEANVVYELRQSWIDSDDYTTLLYSLLGRVAYLSVCVDHMVTDQHKRILIDDLSYLNSLTDHLAAACGKSMAKKHEEISFGMQHILQRIKNQLKSVGIDEN